MNPYDEDPPLNNRLGKAFSAIAWILALSMLWFFFHRMEDNAQHPNRDLNRAAMEGPTVLKQNRQGHYVTPCYLNNYKAQCLLDTGATVVAVSESLAREIGLQKGPEVSMSTANGKTTAHATWLNSVSFGSIELKRVRGIIAPNMGSEDVLLGMSALKSLKITQDQGKLTLTQ